jgi:hypothetical protein
MLTGATNFFNDKANSVKNQLNGQYDEVPNVQRACLWHEQLSFDVSLQREL